MIDELAEQHDEMSLDLLAPRDNCAASRHGFAELSAHKVEEHSDEEAHEKQNRQRQRDKRGIEKRQRVTARSWLVDGDPSSLVAGPGRHGRVLSSASAARRAVEPAPPMGEAGAVRDSNGGWHTSIVRVRGGADPHAAA